MFSRNQLLIAPVLAVVLAACGTATANPDPVDEPAAPSPTVSPAPTVAPEPTAPPATGDGTITIVGGGSVSGPGGNIGDALDAALDQPYLVNGVLLKDLDGKIWLCDSLTDTTPVACDGLVLEVLEYPTGGAEWELENADITVLQESEGVLYFEFNQLFGVVEAA
ncbi:MAG TPA: hypothetical protein VMP86_05675 [Candidatus Binatia bacterium]|nr:hypothetical protein [Candidatus Binatia bacterium]